MIKSNQSWYWTLNPNYINVELHGGIGNQLFQLAFLDFVSRTNSAIPILENTKPISTHSQQSYFDTIFKKWKCIEKAGVKFDRIIHEKNLEPQNWKFDTPTHNIKLIGYFHNANYIDPFFYKNLDFSESLPMLEKYPDIQKCVFLHIRGGDYLIGGNADIYININKLGYYENAVDIFPKYTKFVIFTNDIKYAKTHDILNRINHQFIYENEVDSLFLMSKCAGGICANSTFSWWGGVLNRCMNTNSIITIPSRWYHTGLYSGGYLNNIPFKIIKTGNPTFKFSRGKFRLI